MKIPIIINNFNLLTWPSKMLDVCKTFEDVGDLIIIDNNSTYEPLLVYPKRVFNFSTRKNGKIPRIFKNWIILRKLASIRKFSILSSFEKLGNY